MERKEKHKVVWCVGEYEFDDKEQAYMIEKILEQNGTRICPTCKGTAYINKCVLYYKIEEDGFMGNTSYPVAEQQRLHCPDCSHGIQYKETNWIKQK